MIGWGWLILAFILGDAMGITVMAICFSSWDRKEQKTKKDR